MALAEVISEHITGRLLFAVEPMAEFLREGAPLFVRHREEVTKDKDVLILAVDEEYYGKSYQNGHSVVVTARHLGQLVGYMLWTLATHPHYKNVLCAQDDVHYLLPEYRRGMNGYLLIKNAMRLVEAAGARYCYVREKIGHEHPAVMQRLGLKPLDVTYSCKLGETS